MSEERAVDVTVGKVQNKTFSELTKAEKKARLATILDRGFVHDRLVVELPNGLYGEWVINEPTEITRMRSMGFELDNEHANKRALHGGAGIGNVVGDVIFMTAPMEVKEIIDEIRMAKFQELNGKPNRVNHEQKEEAEFAKNASLPTINESSESGVDAAAIKSAIFSQ